MHASKLVCDASTLASPTADGGPDVPPQTLLSDVTCGENIRLDVWGEGGGQKNSKLLEGQLYVKKKKKERLIGVSARGVWN